MLPEHDLEAYIAAAILPEVRFSFERYAAMVHKSDWTEVAAKAKRLIQEGRVTILRNTPTHVMAHVIGDGTDNNGKPDEHDVEITRHDPNSQILEQWNCFLGDAPVTMADGTTKRIDQVQVGEFVLSHTGTPQPVLAVIPRLYSGHIVRAKVSGIHQEVVATADHRFWTTNRAAHLKRLTPSGRWKNTGSTAMVESTVDWHEIGSLVENDYFTAAFPQEEKTLTVACVGTSKARNTKTGRFEAGWSSGTWEIDDDLAYLLGWYIAEGMLIKSDINRVGFTFNIDEMDVVMRLSDICLRKFGTPGTVRQPKGTKTIDFRVSHYALWQICRDLAGTGSRTKRLAEGLMYMPKRLQTILLDAWLRGDGCCEKRRNMISTVSPALASQLRVLLGRLGYASSMRRQASNPGGLETTKRGGAIFHIRWSEQTVARPERFYENEMCHYRISSLVREHYEGLVYDLTVDEDHSFQVYGVSAHNCTCAWADYSWDRTRKWKKYEGRPCHLPGSIVSMADGTYKPIEDVEVGDRVVTHDGIGIVSQTMKRPYVGQINEIYRMGFPHPIRVTNNHEIWGVRTPTKVREASYNVSPSPGQGFKICDPSFLSEDPAWIDAQDLQVNDWVASTWSEKLSMEGSESLAIVLGLYLAEGNLAKRSGSDTWGEIQWTFHKDEESLIVLLQGALTDLGYGQLRRYYRDNAVSVRLTSRELADELYRLGGHLAREKVLNADVMAWDRDVITVLISSFALGDGEELKDGRVRLNTASDTLARQFFDLLIKCGHLPSWTIESNNQGPGNRDGRNAINRLKYVPAAKAHNGRRGFKHHYLSKIRRIEKYDYTGLVYNLSVDEQESYVVEGVTNHNCSHVIATYWKAKSTPLDTTGEEEGYQVPRGQRQSPAGPGQMPIPGINEAPPGTEERNFAPDEEGQPAPGEPTQAPPPPSTTLPSDTDITIPKAPTSPFSVPKQPPPQHEQLELFDITAPPGQQQGPSAPIVSVPGGSPPTPGNPVKFPGTFSHFIPVLALHTGHFIYAADSLTEYFDTQRAAGQPIHVALMNTVALERSGGKIPIPGAQPYGVSSEGIPLYNVMDLGWNPNTQSRENADVNLLQGAPEQTGTYSDVTPGRYAEVLDYEPALKMAYIVVPLNYPGGEDARLHPHLLKGWVGYSDLRPVAPKRSPFRRKK